MSAKRTVPTVVDATTLKMSLGSIGERVRTADLQITKHGTPQAVVISVDRYHRLTRLEPVDPSSLEALRQEFDDKLARMQSAQQGGAMNRLMDADEDDINRFLNKHYDQNPVSPMVKPAEAFATGSKRVVRSKPFNAIQVLTVPMLKAKRPISERLTVVETKQRKLGGSASGVVIHHKAGKVLSVAASAATATKPRKRAK
ncbi:type II toxin-antitoxin system prevent-host-death family antitoxin [uncultured Nevskia sp.]|uniref:type II toxin-antitoxin system prevent-host-death family antitoxin n=1 Tax=uncultured Nevskia sp. TaxID=228950 RepID=UPI0025EE2F9E|nr:type II toxin-antitoxin system prevent-host-death family antitoxin [uncultured Nevskia sp.]